MACKVSLKLLQESPYQLHFVDEMRMEYGIMVRLIHHPDFREGVRALLIDKDRKPDWNPSRPEAIGDARRRQILRAASSRGGMAAVRFLGDDAMSEYETILVEKKGAVTLVTLNRPQALNALNSTVLKELIAVFADYDADPEQRCLVLTGSEKAFAAGADIKEMSTQGFADMYVVQLLRRLGSGHADPQAVDRGGRRLCARRRVRGGDDGRLHHRRGHRRSSASPRSSSESRPAWAGRSG